MFLTQTKLNLNQYLTEKCSPYFTVSIKFLGDQLESIANSKNLCLSFFIFQLCFMYIFDRVTISMSFSCFYHLSALNWSIFSFCIVLNVPPHKMFTLGYRLVVISEGFNGESGIFQLWEWIFTEWREMSITPLWMSLFLMTSYSIKLANTRLLHWYIEYSLVLYMFSKIFSCIRRYLLKVDEWWKIYSSWLLISIDFNHFKSFWWNWVLNLFRGLSLAMSSWPKPRTVFIPQALGCLHDVQQQPQKRRW